MYLLTTTHLHELFKLPVLIEHFVEHKQQNKILTFWQFLCMHYANGDVKDADYDKDMKLPFKSHTDCSSNFVFVSVPSSNAFIFLVKKQVLSDIKPSIYFKEQHLIDAYLSSIWQPPKSY